MKQKEGRYKNAGEDLDKDEKVRDKGEGHLCFDICKIQPEHKSEHKSGSGDDS